MKKIKKIAFIFFTVSIMYINIQSIINNLLNKKYIVNEIPFSQTKQSLNGLFKEIDLDYTSFRWILLINTIYILILAIYILRVNIKK